MNQFEVIKYYSRPDIQKKMIEIAKNREVVGSLKDGSFLSRPDILLYPKDIEERAKMGVVAFHCSVERWTQPMQLSTGLSPKDLDNMRKGFDFILDIDAKAKLEHAIVGTRVAYNFLKDLGIKPTIKFSGSRGFHISISSEAFPEKIDFQETKNKYPEIPQTIADYLREKIKDQLLEELIAMEGGVASLVNTVPSVTKLSPYEFIEFEKDWGNRHLFRMPYSLHPKFWLVSMPLKIGDLKSFNRLKAKPENVKTNADFLVNKEGEATELLLKSLDWKAKQPKEIKKDVKIRRKLNTPIPEEYFPPCIKLILKGIPDGKKRSLFSLSTFLRAMNWNQEEIEKRMIEWNKNNSPPLVERSVRTQLKWHSRQSRELMPANCNSGTFYTSLGVCKPDRNCKKNPVNYPFMLMKRNKKLRK
ncbi:MAG: DNA primase small subunit domain-containing protein [Candidatus Aenigmatarchaeota archaeon]